jgi:hypothetical protein
VLALSDEIAALGAVYETYQGSREGTFFQDWAQLYTQADPVRFDRVRTFLDHLDRANIWAWLPFHMASAAELSGRYGDEGMAAALLERAGELVNITGGRWCEAEIMRLRARFGTRNSDGAATLLRGSLETARQQGAKLWELRTATDLAALLSNQKKDAEACAILRPIFEWFKEGKDTADYTAAQALLGEIEERHSRMI